MILRMELVFRLVQDQKKYTGIVEDCCCDYETVDSINQEFLHPLLQELVTTPFFRYFKVQYSTFYLETTIDFYTWLMCM